MNNRKRKFKHRKHTVKVIFEPDYDHEAWSTDACPTPETIPDAFNRYTIPAYPTIRFKSTRKKSHYALTSSRLKRRLYQAGVRGAEAKRILGEILAGQKGEDGYTNGSWHIDDFKKQFGARLAKRLMKFVRVIFVILDEYGYYAQPGISSFVEKSMSIFRKHSAKPIIVEQTMPVETEPAEKSHVFSLKS